VLVPRHAHRLMRAFAVRQASGPLQQVQISPMSRDFWRERRGKWV